MYCKECGENLSEQEVEENGGPICNECRWDKENREAPCTCEACWPQLVR